MNVKNISVLFFVILTFSVVSCTNNDTSITLVDSDEFQELMKEDVFIINTHTPYEGEIPGTDLIAYEWNNMYLYEESLPKDKDTTILVYCRSGRMSSSASRQIAELGYKNIYELKGGMIAWKASSKEIIYTQ